MQPDHINAIPPPATRPTWQIAADIANAFDPETGEIDAARVDALTCEMADKAEAVHHVLRAWDAEQLSIRAERERLAARSAQIDARDIRLRAYLLGCMRAAGQRKLQTALVTCSIRAGSERVEVSDQGALSAEFLKATIKPDKDAIKDALKAGREVPGAQLVRGEESIAFR